MKKLTKEQFIEKAIIAHGSKFDYSKVHYTGVDAKVVIICPVHGEFTQTPYGHVTSKYGCTKCGIAASAASKHKSTEDFVKRAIEIHGTKYDYSNTTYKSAKEKLAIVCPDHGEFTQLASGHLSGYGCSKCANYGKGRVDMNKPCTLYYFNIVGTDLYKIGITTQSMDNRYRTSFDRDQINIIFTKQYQTGREAYNEEQALLSKYSSYLYNGNKVLKSGNTEVFTKDIFDNDYSEYTSKGGLVCTFI
jgi:hypothetical protein